MLLEHIRSQFNSLPFTRCFGIDKVEVVVGDRGEFDAEVMSSALVLVRNGGALCKFSKVGGILRQVQAHGDIRSPLVGTLIDIDAFHTGHELGIIATLSGNKHVVSFLAEVVGEFRVRNLRRTTTILVVIGVGPSRPEASRIGVAVAVFHVVDEVRRGTIGNTGGESVITRIGTKVVAKAAIGIGRALVHPTLHHVTRLSIFQSLVQGQSRKRSGLFGNSGGRPVRPGDAVLVHPVHPSLAGRLVRRAVTVGTDRTPFCSEHGNAIRHSLSGTVIVTAVTRLVRCSIEVERATEVLLAILNACLSALFRMAGPIRAAHEHEVVGMLTNSGNHGVRVRSDRSHIGTDRFVPDFENHVVVFAIFLSGIFEELDSFRSIAVCTFDVPVDNHVNVVFDSGIDHVLEVALLQGFTLRAAQVATALVLELFLSHTHCKADDFDVHLLHHGVHGLFGIENGRAICTRTPEEAHALDLDGLVGVVRASTGKLAAICLKFTISAYRPSTVSTNCHSRRYGSAHQKCEDLFHKHPFGFTQSPQPYNPI